MSNTKQTAKIAAAEDAKQTGPAGLPDTQPAGVKPRLTDEQRQKRKAETLAAHERLIEARTQQVCHFLADMGIASLAGRISEYSDLGSEYVEAALVMVEQRVAACRAALASRSVKASAAPKVDLRSLATKLQAQKNGATLSLSQ